MKVVRKVWLGLLVLAVSVIVIFAAGRCGWKLFGFRACQGAAIESVEVGEDAVKIRGCYPGSFPEGFCGYYAEEQDGKLYVGFRFSAVFGFFENGYFDISVPVKGIIDEVILKTKTEETVIWTAVGGDSPKDVPQELTLPILDDINENVYIGTAGSSLIAIQEAVKLLDWGTHTGLDTKEISDAAVAWFYEKDEETRSEFIQKLTLVDDAYQKLLGSDAEEWLDTAGCAQTDIFWGNEPLEPIEAVMQAAGLRD